MKYSLAIDFGSVYTSIYRKDEGLILKEPSLICARQSGDRYEILACGIEAKKMQGKTDDKTYIFSPISEGKIKAPEYAAFLLDYFLKKIEKPFVKENAIFCVSSVLSKKEKQEFVSTFSDCKIKNIALVPSIVCASVMAGVDIGSSKTVFAMQIGGTVSEVALINMNRIIKGGALELGGRTLDVEIANIISDRYSTAISIASAQKLKEEISSLYENDVQSYEVVGFDEESNKPTKIIVSSAEIMPATQKFANMLALTLETTINVCPPEILADIFSNGLYLFGGSSNISGIDKYLRKQLNIDVKIVEDNDNACILGAGKLLSDMASLKEIIANF